ncbi:MAG TPA: hypothetical protein VGO57_17600 [Verrucomicrobiae bacterium]|jgi:hypothetical protein
MRFCKIKAVRRKDFIMFGSLIVLFLLVAVFCVSLISAKNLAERAQSIKLGDSKEKVREMLGAPTETYLPRLFGVNYETWAYGHRFRLSSDFPYFTYNLRLSLFHPETDEICISFDSHSNVVNVYVPGVNSRTK